MASWPWLLIPGHVLPACVGFRSKPKLFLTTNLLQILDPNGKS